LEELEHRKINFQTEKRISELKAQLSTYMKLNVKKPMFEKSYVSMWLNENERILK